MRTSLITPLTTPVALSGWAFLPGPEQMNEPTDSQFANEISQHPARTVATTLLNFPGMELVHPADPSWYQWKAQWRYGGRFLDFTMTLFDDLEETWGGSGLEAECLAGDIMGVWSFLLAKHRGIWLYAPDCMMHTQHSFLEELSADVVLDPLSKTQSE